MPSEPNLRGTLKQSSLATTCFRAVNPWIRKFLARVSPYWLSRYRYRIKTGRKLCLNPAVSFDEKLLWLMLYWQSPLKTRCADKYTLRSYVEEQGLGHILPELHGVYTSAQEIDPAVLPNRFVLKCTHGSGFNIVCVDKTKLDWADARKKLDAWLRIDFSKVAGELHYAAMRPRIVCERFLDDLAGELPVDYKVYCFRGAAYCTMVCAGRGSNAGLKFDFYDREWKNKLAFSRSSMLENRVVNQPASYAEMIAVAEKLSQPFPFVRMDFYNIAGRAVIGEMTFTPNGCIDPGLTDEAQRELGKRIQLPEKLLA
jgi:hypothetical protein